MRIPWTPAEEAAIREATTAWVATFKWLQKGRARGQGKAHFKGVTADEVLTRRGFGAGYRRGRASYWAMETEVRRRAYRSMGIKRAGETQRLRKKREKKPMPTKLCVCGCGRLITKKPTWSSKRWAARKYYNAVCRRPAQNAGALKGGQVRAAQARARRVA